MSATDRYSHQLLYATVRQRLLDDIAQGVYQAGQQIPTENELCTQYNVSRITIRKAISDLVADGVLIRWQGKGTFVQSQKVENALLTVSGFTDFGVSQGKATKEKVIEQERVSAAPFCEKLNIPGNSEVFHLCRVMYLDKEPLFIDSSWIPLSRYPDCDEIYAFKGPEFKAGQRISVGDICRLQQMGRFHVAVVEDAPDAGDLVHENDVAEAFARRMAGPGVTYKLPPHEGKIDFIAEREGLFSVDAERMFRFNMLPEIMVASRQDATVVGEGARLAGTRAIPLYISRSRLGEALSALGEKPLFEVLPLRKAKVGILVTGTEVFQGIIEDKFIPVITAKAHQFHCDVVRSVIAPDDVTRIAEAVREIQEAGADLLVTTGGLSVDPDDMTRRALLEAGLTDVLHGVPVLPGTMSLMGRIPGDLAHPEGMQVLGVPACALYYKTTFLDLVLPRLLAGRELTRAELARIGEGGYCLGCKICTYPKCSFGK